MPHDPQIYDRSKIFLSDKSTHALLLSVPNDSNFYKLFSKNSVVYAKLPDNKLKIAEELYATAASCFENGREEQLSLSFFSLMCLISEFPIHNIKESDEFMGKALEYINSNLSSQISLDELCSVVNISKSHFCRRFKQIMGITVMEYILTTRIAAAKNLLLSDTLSISQISERCGFSSVSFFCQTFKAKEGITAKKFRQKECFKKLFHSTSILYHIFHCKKTPF